MTVSWSFVASQVVAGSAGHDLMDAIGRSNNELRCCEHGVQSEKLDNSSLTNETFNYDLITGFLLNKNVY